MVMMRFCVCCWWWCELWGRLWMLVSVLTGGRTPPETEIWRSESHVRTIQHYQTYQTNARE